VKIFVSSTFEDLCRGGAGFKAPLPLPHHTGLDVQLAGDLRQGLFALEELLDDAPLELHGEDASAVRLPRKLAHQSQWLPSRHGRRDLLERVCPSPEKQITAMIGRLWRSLARWEQLPGEFLGEVWVAALPWDVQRPVQRSASSSLTSQRRDDTELPHQVEQRRDAPVLQRP